MALTKRGLRNFVVSMGFRSVKQRQRLMSEPEMNSENLTFVTGYIVCLEHYGRPTLKARFKIGCKLWAGEWLY